MTDFHSMSINTVPSEMVRVTPGVTPPGGDETELDLDDDVSYDCWNGECGRLMARVDERTSELIKVLTDPPSTAFEISEKQVYFQIKDAEITRAIRLCRDCFEIACRRSNTNQTCRDWLEVVTTVRQSHQRFQEQLRLLNDVQPGFFQPGFFGQMATAMGFA